MFDVIHVTHQNMMTISGTHRQGLHSTQVRHYTQIDLLTCRVCSVKHMIIMREYFPRLWYDPYPLHARGLGLHPFSVRWSVICCQEGFLMAFAKGALPEEYLSHNFDEQCLGGH